MIGENTAYTGTFNGLGNTISNLTISTGATYAGLFGQLGSGGTIENVGLIGGSVTGTSGGTSAGGLVGYLRSSGTIMSSYATGAVSGGFIDGGLVGYQNGGVVTSNYATGAVSGGTYDGGLVGQQVNGVITSSYATGPVSGPSYDGGLAGYQNGMITSSYATGAVSGGIYDGGLVGVGSTIASSYWDTATSGLSRGVGFGNSSGVTGVTTAGLASAGVLSALNRGGTVFANVNNQTTPYIISNPAPVFLASDASARPAVYDVVLTTAQLEAINNNLSANYVLGQNIDATGYTGFTPIGESTAYSGTFNGLGNTISNLTISTGANNAGLFGQLGASGTIENVGLIGGSVTGSSSGPTGGLVGRSSGAIVSSYATGAVLSGDYTGGLIGMSFGTITSSYATGAVSGHLNVGGLVGVQESGGAIVSSYATGAVSGGTNTGGLVGHNTGAITSSYATGAVGNIDGGGLIGMQDSAGSIMSSYWDTSTSGLTRSMPFSSGSQTNVAGYTTAQLQGLAPISGSTDFSAASQLSSAFSGGTGGLYPYLTSVFPTACRPCRVSPTAMPAPHRSPRAPMAR